MEQGHQIPLNLAPAGRPPRPYWVTVLFLFLALGLLWVPTRWLVECSGALHGRRALTPALLSGPAGGGPALVARRTTEIRSGSDGTRPITFRLLAPAARDVFLGGSFNKFDASQHPMARGENGIWEITVPLPPGRHAYKFKVDGEWILDPTNPEQTPEPRETSLINVRS